MKFRPLATNIHGHAHASLDGGSTSYQKLLNASEQGRPTDCLTDHGLMSGLAEHWFAAEKISKDPKITNKVKSIHGIEVYIIDWNRPYKEFKNGKKEPYYYHLTIHFKTQKAYQYFCSLTPQMENRAIVKWGEAKPLITIDELKAIAGEVTIGSGCMLSPIGKNIVAGRSDWAIENYELLRAIAGPGNFWVEVMPHEVSKDWKKPVKDKESGRVLEPGVFVPITQRMDANAIDKPFEKDECTCSVDLQKPVNEFSIKMAAKYGDPVVISLDDHFAKIEDEIIQRLRLSQGEENWRFSNAYAAYDSDHCAKMFQKQLGISDVEIEKWIDNGYQFIELFNNYKFLTSKDQSLLPKMEDIYEIKPENTTSKLLELIEKHGRMPKTDDPKYQVYKDRLDYELSVLRDNGKFDLLPYFFVVEDVVSYLRSVGSTNAARGSAGGVLMAYLIGLTMTDPIKYELPFERFITLDKILKTGSMPDFDLDIDNRDVVLKYLKDKYKDKVALISTDMNIKLKYAIKDTERMETGVVEESTELMCKKLPQTPQGMSTTDWLFGYKDKTTGEYIEGIMNQKEEGSILLKEYSEKKQGRWNTILRAIGITRSRGIHAGGVIIAPEDVSNYIPLIKHEQNMASGYEMKALESIGIIKYDFLGLDTLWALGVAMKGIKDDLGIDIPWEEFPHDDNVYREILHKDKLAGVFQLNTKIVKPFIKQTMPRKVKDLAALTALCRPGCLDSEAPNPNFPGTAADYYVAVAQGKEAPYFIHPSLKPIFQETNSICVYQEQSMRVFNEIADYTLDKTDDIRKAIGKKNKELMDLHLGNLRAKCLEKGWTEEQARQIVETLVKSANYSFNKSHSTAYAIIAYNCCWLKYHYPIYFWKGILTVFQDDFSKIANYLPECAEFIGEINVLISDKFEWKIHNGKLIPPLSFVKGAGDKGVDTILNLLKISGLRNG